MSLVKWRILRKRRKPDKKGENVRYRERSPVRRPWSNGPDLTKNDESGGNGENLSGGWKVVTLARKITKGLTQIEMRLQKIFLVKWRIWYNRQKPDQKGENGRCAQKITKLEEMEKNAREMSPVKWQLMTIWKKRPKPDRQGENDRNGERSQKVRRISNWG